MDNISVVSNNLKQELEGIEGSFNLQVGRLRHIESHIKKMLKRARRLLRTMPHGNWVKTLPIMVDILDEVQRVLGKIDEVDIEKQDIVDHDVELSDIAEYVSGDEKTAT